MARRKRRVHARKEVDFFLDQLVVIFLLIPLLPWALLIAGQEESFDESEISGLVLLAALFWAIAVPLAWHAGGVAYLIENVAYSLALLSFVPWLFVLLGEPAPRGDALARVLIGAAVAWAIAALLP